MPSFVEKDLRAYLQCGILACGFVRMHCSCGTDVLVAYSCKGRGMCPSCGARRMFETAANLVDVLPDVPLRQWVLGTPFELHAALAAKGDLLAAVNRIFIDVVQQWMLRKATSEGFEGGQSGAVTLVQRFGSKLNLHPHFHTLVLEGLYRPGPDDEVEFHPVGAPTEADEHAVSAAVCRRVERLLVRRGLVGEGADARPGSALERWYQRAVAERTKVSRIDEHGRPWSATYPVPGRQARAGEVLGFSVHARVRVQARSLQDRVQD